MSKDLIVTKASGEAVRFSEEKLRASLRHSGATNEQIDHIIEGISGELYEGISTKKIYKLAFGLLKGKSRSLAAKYHLKGAIMELGPSGFPFEKFIGEILRYQGYTVKVGEIVQGQCVQHEIDVIATTDHSQMMIECKYHNLRGTICDVKIPLYIHSRFKDVEAQWLREVDGKSKSYQGWVVTNTKFSDDAIRYGTCVGLKLIGWDYPMNGSLKDQIDRLGLYPITCLTSLTKNEKQFLLEHNVVLCQELYNSQFLLKNAGIGALRVETVMHETNQLCKLLNADKSKLLPDGNKKTR